MKGDEPTSQHRSETAGETNGESVNTTTLDPDLAGYFLVRSTSPASESLSPKYPSKNLPGKPRSDRSGSSRGRKHGLKPPSGRSSISGPSKSHYIEEWNEESMSATLLSSSWSHHDMRHPADPPRSPKQGHEWVWFPQGYWAERQLSNFISSGGSSSKHSSRQKWWNRTPEPKTPSVLHGELTGRTPFKSITPKFEIPRIKIGSISRKPSSTEVDRRRSSSQKSLLSLQLGGFAFMKQKSDDRSSSQEDKPLGLYCRTKRNIRQMLLERSRLAYDEVASTRPPGLKSRTTVLLEGTSQYLDEAERERVQMQCGGVATPRSMASFVSLDGRLRRGFGLAPWHRRTSHESVFSATSSIRGLLMGKNPTATPIIDGKYMGPNGELFQRVEISSSDPREPTCLPSEARRINTPPLEPGTPTLNARGVFFDLGSARGGSTASPSDNGHSAKSHHSHQSGASGDRKGKSKQIPSKESPQGLSRPSSPGSTEWWEADTKHSEKGNKSTDSKPKLANRALPSGLPCLPSSFVLELPEHLPSSPMCPKHPLNKSGGAGICPSHGRRRSVGLKNLKRVETEESRAS